MTEELALEPAWIAMTDAEIAALAPFVLFCEDLSDDARATIRAEYTDTVHRCLRAFVGWAKREPDEREFGLLRRAASAHFNAAVIPAALAREHPERLN